MKQLVALCVSVMLAIVAIPASALSPLSVIDQIYSNADGTVQFIVVLDTGGSDCDSGEAAWAGQTLVSTGPGPQKTFVFPTNLPTCRTSGRHILIATEGFAALGLVAPDFIIPNGFLQLPNGSVNLGNVAGAAYTALPSDGVMAINRRGMPIQNVAKNLAGASASVVPSNPPPATAANYEGLWWKFPAESESGWGINLAHQGDVIFVTWFTYDLTGRAWWLSMIANKTAEGVYSGSIYQTHGPAFSAVPFNPSAVTATQVGTGTLSFTDANTGTFAYTVNGVSQVKPITYEVFGPLPTCTFGAQANLAAATNYQDLWYAAPAESEAGWGVNFTHHGDIIFATWFTYDVDGTPLWLVATINKTGPGVYTGKLYRTTGPAFNAVPFLPANVSATEVGTLTVTFAHGNSATFAYTVALSGAASAVTQTKNIVRQVFRTPGTVCQ